MTEGTEIPDGNSNPIGRRAAAGRLCSAVGLVLGICFAAGAVFLMPSRSDGVEPPSEKSDASSLSSVLGGKTGGGNSDRKSPIEATGDEMEYNGKTGWTTAKGHVVIRRGNEELHADYVRVNMNTEDAEAIGNVILKRPGGAGTNALNAAATANARTKVATNVTTKVTYNVWKGKQLRYNFRTKIGDAAELVGDMAPFHVTATHTQKTGANEYLLSSALVTTCTNEPGECHWHSTARELEVVPGQSLRAHGAVFYLGPLPVMYMPFWYRNLREDFGFRFYAGASSRMGIFLLTGYRYPITEVLKGETDLDYRSRRGVGVGQDLKWRDPEGGYYGDITAYYINDRDPLDENGDKTSAIENNRYRVRLRNTCNISDADYVLLQAHYLSDPLILEDFFTDEYAQSTQPDNYLSYTHREQDYTANLIFRTRLNDFYSNVNRLPEASVSFSRQQIEDTPFYYEGQTAAGYLQKVREKTSSEEDYSAFRLDSSHMIYYPTKQFEFLNVIPRSGYRATYYSATFDTAEGGATLTTNFTVNSDGTTNATVSTNTVMSNMAKGGQLRSRLEFGMETSFKAFKTWESDNDEMPLRHIVEPYANYTLVPEPNLLPENIYQFDEVDTLDKEQWVKVGVRNKLQTKNNGLPFDFVDLDTYAILNIERAEGQAFLNYLYWKGEFQTLGGLDLKVDGILNVQESIVDTFNTQLGYTDPETLAANIEYRFKTDDSSLLSETATFYLSRNWYVNIYGRYEFEVSQLEEVGGYLQRNYDCMAVRTGAGFLPGYTQSDGTVRNDEWRITFELWLTAFPGFSISGNHRN
jgi:LPS-assembly protein